MLRAWHWATLRTKHAHTLPEKVRQKGRRGHEPLQKLVRHPSFLHVREKRVRVEAVSEVVGEMLPHQIRSTVCHLHFVHRENTRLRGRLKGKALLQLTHAH